MSVEPKNPLRNTYITLNISFKNNDTDSLKVGYIKCSLDPRFRAKQIKVDNSKEININTGENIIKIIPDGNVKMNEFKNYSCSVFVPLNIKANENYSIISKIEIVIHGYDASKNINTSESSIYVQNNPPNINSAEAHLISNQLKEINGNLFFLGNASDQIKLELNISANDKESEELSFGCHMIGNFESENFVNHLTNEINCPNNFNLSLKNIKYNSRYSLLALARDTDRNISDRKIDLIFNGRVYQEIWTPDIPKSQLIALLISLILTFFITIIILNRFGSYEMGRIFSLKKLAISLTGIWALYFLVFPMEPRELPESGYLFNLAAYLSLFIIISYFVAAFLRMFMPPKGKFFTVEKLAASLLLIWVSYLLIPGSGYMFFNSQIFLELVVYLSVFLVISYFIEICFSLDDANIPIISLFSNSLIMIIILIGFMWLFPKNPAATHDLSIYYGTMAGFYGTVFALIVTLSGQFPKNIFTIPAHLASFSGKKCPPGAPLPSGETLLYLKKLKYFVVLYGISLGLSLLGLILGAEMRYDTLITGPLQETAILLMPVVLFETTFLLIPPTIISMYHLMQVASFRGKVTIISDPQGADVCLSKCRLPQKSTSIGYLDSLLAKSFPILRPESNQGKKDMYYLGLTTPCTLMLTNGEYRICLRTKDHRLDKPAKIRSIDGIETEYKFDLIRIPANKSEQENNNISASNNDD